MAGPASSGGLMDFFNACLALRTTGKHTKKSLDAFSGLLDIELKTSHVSRQPAATPLQFIHLQGSNPPHAKPAKAAHRI